MKPCKKKKFYFFLFKMKSKQNDLSFIPGVSADYGVKNNQQNKKSIQLIENNYSEQKLDQLRSYIYPEYKQYMKLKEILEKKQRQLLDKKAAKQTLVEKAAQEELSFVRKQIKRINQKTQKMMKL